MFDAAPIMERRLPPGRVRRLRSTGELSDRRGVGLYIVGGAVRDMLLSHTPTDMDLTSVGGGPELAADLARQLGGEVIARSQFGTSKVRVADAVVDLAVARRESYAHPGALPTVSTGSIHEDLARRDFTINAMAISLAPGEWGQLVDLFDGRADLRRRLVRVLRPGSFVDDATRILRAVRYANRLGFQLESDTEGLMRRSMSYLDTIKGDRVRHEMQRIFGEDRVASILGLAQDLGVLSAIHPAVSVERRALTRLRHAGAVPANETDLRLLSLLAFSVPSGALPSLIARLNMDSHWAAVARDTGSVREIFTSLRSPGLRPSQTHDLLRRFSPAAIRGCAMATDEPLIARRLEQYDAELRHVRTALGGGDLIALGVPEGPMVGELLSEILTARLDGTVTAREDESRIVARRLGRSRPS